MISDIPVNTLLESSQWRQFLESTAAALQINLEFLIPGSDESISVCEICPICLEPLLPLSSAARASALNAALENQTKQGTVLGSETELVVFEIQDKFRVIARSYPCCKANAILPFQDRVTIAKDLLNNFLAILADHWNGGQIAAELSTLHQINHIVLSMFRGENNALERVLDLILSAAIILFDADGSWIEYTMGKKKRLLTKGDCNTSSNANNDLNNCITAAVVSSAVEGQLGINTPDDAQGASSFLHLMVQECVIVFEIDYLVKLMESKFTLILDTIESLVLMVDQRMNICYANRAAEKLLGRTTMELLGIPITGISAPWIDCILTKPGKTVSGIKDPFKNFLGNCLVDWAIYPFAGDDDISGWLVIADDRSEFYRLQEIGEQAEKMVHTSTLLSVLAHEIRNPLATFRGVLQLIEQKQDSPDLNKYIEIGLKEVDRVTKLLNDFLLIGKPLDIAKEPVDLKTFLEDIIPLLNEELHSSSIEVITIFEPVPPVQVDPGQLTQVIFNLVRNAFESVKNTGYVYISLKKLEDDWVEISVHDTGLGLTDEVKDKLFQPFYTTKKGGTGLGLMASKAIINSHGGKIFAYNHHEGGAVFTIHLPVKSHGKGMFHKIDVLLVTNDEMLRLPTEQVLRTENIKLATVNSFDEAMPILNRYLPAVIISENDSIDAQIYARIRMRFPAINIIIAGENHKLSALKDVYFLPKPLNYAKLLSKIKPLI